MSDPWHFVPCHHSNLYSSLFIPTSVYTTPKQQKGQAGLLQESCGKQHSLYGYLSNQSANSKQDQGLYAPRPLKNVL